MNDLGPVISEHHGRFAAGGIAWYVGGIMFVLSIAGLGKEALAGAWGNLPYFLGFMTVTGLWLFYNYTRKAQRLTIHQHGFVWHRVVRAPLSVRFADVVSTETTGYRSRNAMHLKGVHTEVELRLRDGKTVTLTNDIDGVEMLAGYAASPPAAAPAGPWG